MQITRIPAWPVQSVPAAVRCVRREASPCDTGGRAQLSILYWTAPQRAAQHSQTRHCYLGEKGPWSFRWLENTPTLVSPDTLRGQAYDTEEL